jgi:hypothetical protein
MMVRKSFATISRLAGGSCFYELNPKDLLPNSSAVRALASHARSRGFDPPFGKLDVFVSFLQDFQPFPWLPQVHKYRISPSGSLSRYMAMVREFLQAYNAASSVFTRSPDSR